MEWIGVLERTKIQLLPHSWRRRWRELDKLTKEDIDKITKAKMGLFLEAAEADEYGYQFAVRGELEEDQESLWKRLVDKVSDGISERFIEEKDLHGKKYSSMKNDEFVGRLAYSEESDHHVVVIDGKPYSWDEVGKMLDAYEGFKIQVKISDMTD